MVCSFTGRDGEWLDFVASLMAAPRTRWPDEAVSRLLVATFAASASTFYVAGAAGVEQRGWPPEHFRDHFEEASQWGAHRAPTEHPVLRYHLLTGDIRSTQVADVPAVVADARLVAAWNERGRRWGEVQAQLSFPLLFSRSDTRSFVVGRADAFTAAEMTTARRLQRLLVGLDRQIAAMSDWPAGFGPVAAEAADALQLTPRQVAVIGLLAEGLSAAAIGRRLHISERTVQKHLQRCYAKLGVPDRLAAVLRAQHIGLLRTQSPSSALAAPAHGSVLALPRDRHGHAHS